MRNTVIETCEMCSREIQNPVTIKVEGALLRVCSSCSRHGHIVQEQEPSRSIPVKSRASHPTVKTRPRTRSSKDEPVQDLIDGFGNVIRSARQKLKITQEQLSSKTGISLALIKSIETEKIRPTDTDAKKLERELQIELFESTDTDLQFNDKIGSKGTTLGDIAVIKKYDYDD